MQVPFSMHYMVLVKAAYYIFIGNCIVPIRVYFINIAFIGFKRLGRFIKCDITDLHKPDLHQLLS